MHVTHSNEFINGECVNGECVNGECVNGECVNGECVNGECVVNCTYAATQMDRVAQQYKRSHPSYRCGLASLANKTTDQIIVCDYVFSTYVMYNLSVLMTHYLGLVCH